MQIVRFSTLDRRDHLGLLQETTEGVFVKDLTETDGRIFSDVVTAFDYAKAHDSTLVALISTHAEAAPVVGKLSDITLHTPVHSPEVWAAGVTYERSRQARNVETKISDSVYDRVYEAERPELFFKSTAQRTVDPGQPLAIRSDSTWMIPEPEFAVVLSGAGDIIGYTIGNDMSSRDIEGENPLYLPQAKVYRASCSFGPAILLAADEVDPYQLDIILRIYRGDQLVVDDRTSTRFLRRKLEELVRYLMQDNIVFPGTTLFTGTGIVPRDDFSLEIGDRIEIEIPGIGILVNEIGA